MQLHRLKLENFRLHANTDIRFDSGITAVVGPNGTGKTTLLEAIAWAFYGTSAARGPRDSIRRINAPAREPVRVEVEFSLGPHEYRVVRKLNSAELYRDSAGAPIANSQRTVSDRIGALLGMSRAEFFSTYFTGQKELAVMASMGPADRGKFLSRLMGYERLRQAQVLLRARRSELKSAIAEVERTLDDGEGLQKERAALSARVADVRAASDAARRREDVARKDLGELTPRWDQLQEQRDATRALHGDLNLAQQKAEVAARECRRLDQDLADALAARTEAEELRPILEQAEGLQAEFETLDRTAQSAGRRRDLHGEAKAIGEQLEGVARRLAALADAEATATAAEEAKRASEEEVQDINTREETVRTTWIRDRQDADTRHRALLAEYRTAKDDGARLAGEGSEGKCPICARPLGSEYQAVLDTLRAQLDEIQSQGTFLKRRLRQLKGEPDELKTIRREQETLDGARKRAIEAVINAQARVREHEEAQREHERLCERRSEVQASIAELPESYDVERHEELRRIIREMQGDVMRAATLAARAEKAEDLFPQAKAAKTALSACEASVNALAASIADMGFDEARFEATRDQFAAADAELREAELASRDAAGQLRLVETELVAIDRRLAEQAERTARLVDLRREFGLHDELDAALDELRGELNARLRPDLSEVASGFLAELTDGRYHELEITDKYEILILEDGLPKPVISGGEEDIANLVLRVAISQMVAERAGQPLSLLVLDEIFGGLDDERRRNVVELLQGLGARFPQVILITHIEQIKQGVDRVLRVVLDPEDGTARVVEGESLPLGAEHVAA